MAKRKSFLDLFKSGRSQALLDVASGPLTPRGGKAGAAPAKSKRKAKPTDLEKRLILAGQAGELSEFLAPHLPRLSSVHEFSLDEASLYAAERGVTVYHLIRDGVNVADLSRDDLMGFVAEYTATRSARPPPVADPKAENNELKQPSKPKQATSAQSNEPANLSDLDRLLHKLGSAPVQKDESGTFEL
ncbi:hypothetical protein [Bosea sp. (in: a-proteobacteria)]|uniref:hypothetical protein n=1 Tax=Bosea sp. (in: a-proteobacteria) TaxID=1871050 RepID=UPI002B46EE44|nr:hypothetical protein [Bosea sp. (in: a-proteobacteria)]WRH56110.1 MAG: hypothetical protein RSE11_13715 [Bosea sp. (in: a-proteobacteria)]